MLRLRPLALSFTLLSLASACSQARSADTSDASVPTTSLAISADARSVRDHVAAQPAFARLAKAKALRATALGFEASTTTGTVGLGSIDAAFPRRASSALHLATQGSWLDLTPDGLRSNEAEPIEGTLVYRDAAPATDVVFAALDEGIEELRVLRGPEAPSTLRWTVKAAAGTALRVREGIAELVDGDGRVVLAAARPFALDARGARRELDFSLDGESLSARLDPQGLAYPIVVDPLWSTTAPFVVANRINYTVTRLADGRVLVGAGQPSGSGPITSAEIYNPATNTWATAGNMAYARIGGFSALLTSGTYAGRVFVAGGSIPGSEVYNPATGASVGGPAPGVTISSMAGAGGRVLVYNGGSAHSWSSATNTWDTPINLPSARTTAAGLWTMTSVPDGRVLIIAGHGISPTSTTAVDIYRPTSNDFASGAASPVSTENHTATLFAGGTRILIAGGTTVGTKSSSTNGFGAVYDVATNSWGSPLVMIAPRVGHGASLLPNGKVVLAGGGTTGVELFDPAAGAFQVAGNAPVADPGTKTADVSTGGLFFPTRYLFAPGKLGTACIVGYECMSGNCVHGACCSTASCASGQRCDTATKAGTCSKPNGITCATGAECESGLCVDKICCNSACGSQCQACDVPGKLGTCSPVYGPPHSARAACAGAGSADVCQRQLCNGTDVTACHFAAAYTVVCGANTCASGSETHTGTCNGAGKCSDVPRVCGVYTCGATSCKTSCTANTDCIAGFFCDSAKSACVPMVGLGNKCSSALPCNPGLFCTDGACCGVADCGAGSTCGAPGKEGSCVGKQGSACKVDAECGSSSCADGVCCDTACTGQCEACDVAGSAGTCTPVTGKPHGSRTACPGDAANTCANAACDGADRARCAALPGNDQECRPQSCTGGLLTTRALCDGKGECPAKAVASCGGYLCDEAGTACRTSCTTGADCVTGFTCDSGTCKKNTSFCSIDGLFVVDNAGAQTPCSPYRCKDARCHSSCDTSDDCSAGTLCSTDSKTCVQAAPPPTGDDSGGGCATASNTGANTGANAAGGALALLAVALLGRQRRPRPRA